MVILPFWQGLELEMLRSHGQSLLWGEPAQGHVWAVMVVRPHPLRRKVLHLRQVMPIVLRQPFVPHRPIEPLNISVLLWVARLNVFKPDSHLLRPCLD